MADGPGPVTGATILAAIAELRKTTLERLALMEERVLGMERRMAGAAPGGPSIASDADLDSDYGDEKIRKNPKRWNGDSMEGRKMSECPPEFLDVLASHFEFKAEREAEDAAKAAEEAEAAGRHGDDEGAAKAEQVAKDKKKYSGYSRKSAARARGWAARLRAGWKPPEQSSGW